MGNEGSKSETAPPSWGACTTLFDDDAAGIRMLVGCACTAMGEITEGEEHEIPIEHMPTATYPEEVESSGPMTFEEATGTARLDAARRSRAQEVRESEQNFLKEFTTMMRTGLTVVMRGADDKLTPVHLMLVPYKHGATAIEWHFRDQNDKPNTGRLPLDDIATVSPNPDVNRLGFEVAARSFVVASVHDADYPLFFHADSKDICSLLVDGLQMCIKRRRKRRGAKNRPTKAPLADSKIHNTAAVV